MSANIHVASKSKERPKGGTDATLVAIPKLPLGPKGGVSITVAPKKKPSICIEKPKEQEAKDPPPSKPPSIWKIREAEQAAVKAAERAAKEHVGKNSKKPVEAPTLEGVTWEYDVYAAPFVPSQLRSINFEDPGSVVRTRSRHWINYPAYIASFAGTSFLPERPTQVPEPKTQDTSGILKPQSYYDQLLSLWNIEAAAKVTENEENAIYKTILGIVPRSDQEPIWTMSVPGLRDDDPFLEKGDLLQLRQLWVGINDNLVSMPMQATDRNGFTHWIERCWTGVQHDAIIASVNRKEEIVYLEAEGLSPVLSPNFVGLVVNATIPLKHSRLEAQRMILVQISTELSKVLDTPEDDVTTNDGLNDSSALHVGVNNDWIRQMLFPAQEDGVIQKQLRKIPHRKLFDPAVNYEQAHAVNSICINDYGTLPYLISGPPGTGKTKTLVEIAMNLLNTTQVAHILICAPSEAAADTLAQRLSAFLNTKQLLRLNRPKRADNEVKRNLLPFCYTENDMFNIPPFGKLMNYNVVVMSCQDAIILADARLTNNDIWHVERNMMSAFHPEGSPSLPALHWGALLIDEAAQATEIDVLPAINAVCPPSAYPASFPLPLFIMAGDENQLGPRTASRNPQFATSLFARIFDCPLYKDHPLSRTKSKPSAGPPVLKRSMLPILYPPFTNLTRNYRSHPAILSVPSSLFYNDTLIPEAPSTSSFLQQSPLWRGRKWPVLFLPHNAHDEIERDGGGWYNISEANLACMITQKLVRDSGVRQEDICIMSPFAAQVKLLRSLMQSNLYGEMWGVNIGPLEAFQGLESRVVIICTTRTRSRFLSADAKRGMGIVNQKRKMNVALTRAKEALFVIGNPEVLGKDEHWKEWMAFCWRNGLVDDPEKIWDGGKDCAGKEKIGVLEKALVSKEDSVKEELGKRVLGVGTETLDMSRDYELWTESLREALDEESEAEEEDEEGNEEEEYGEEEA